MRSPVALGGAERDKGLKMATNEFDMRSHMGTYTGFTKLLTYGTVGVIVLLVLLGVFVA